MTIGQLLEYRDLFSTEETVMKALQRIGGGLLSAVVVLAIAGPAAAQFRDLVSQLPNGANALMILNVEKILSGPMGQREGWKANLEKAFAAGMVRVPSKAKRFVMAAQIDFEFMKPNWEAVMADLQRVPSMEKIAKEYQATPDKFGDTEAVVLPNDAYVIALSQNTLAAMAPANRQVVARWLQELESPSKLSAYLQRAAGYSDEAGTEIIMAMDLQGAFAPARVDGYLKAKKSLIGAQTGLAGLSRLLAGLEGVRVGIRIGEQPSGKLTVDFRDPVSLRAETANKLLLQLLSDGGLMIDDLNRWKPEVQGATFSLSGNLSAGGLRKMLSFVESPAPSGKAEESAGEKASPGDLGARRGQDTLRYFKTIDSYRNDLKQDIRDSKSISQTKVWFDKYARKIERLPILNVDPEMLDYGALVARGLRAAAGSVTQMGISSAARQKQVQGSTAPPVNAAYYGGYGWDRGGGYAAYGGYAYNLPGANAWANSAYAQVRAEAHQRQLIRSEEKAATAMDVQGIKADLIEATSIIRRRMTERYQVEF